MLQKLGKKHRLLPAGPLWPGELAHWRTRGLSSPELPVLLLGNIKGLGTVLLRRACQPLSLSLSLSLSPCLSLSLFLSRLWRKRRRRCGMVGGVFDGYSLPLLRGFLRHIHLSPRFHISIMRPKTETNARPVRPPLYCPGGHFESELRIRFELNVMCDFR